MGKPLDQIPPSFDRIDLTLLQDEGVLMAANERFFWPLGLALTWDHDHETGAASNLHVREWVFGDGHHESIELETDDAVGTERRERFAKWLAARATDMPIETERWAALALAATPSTPEATS